MIGILIQGFRINTRMIYRTLSFPLRPSLWVKSFVWLSSSRFHDDTSVSYRYSCQEHYPTNNLGFRSPPLPQGSQIGQASLFFKIAQELFKLELRQVSHLPPGRECLGWWLNTQNPVTLPPCSTLKLSPGHPGGKEDGVCLLPEGLCAALERPPGWVVPQGMAVISLLQ